MQSEGGRHNNHRGADQWPYVLSGRGVAIGRARRVALKRADIAGDERAAGKPKKDRRTRRAK